MFIATKEQDKFIRDNVAGKLATDLTDIFNKEFGTEVTVGQIRAFKQRNKLRSGIDCRIKKGSTPANKGVKGIVYEGCKKTWFKKGGKPINHKEVGSERVTKDGYTEIKVAEPNKWALKQRFMWEKYHGKPQKGYTVVFGDGDKSNFSIDNLILVSRHQLLIMNKKKLIKNDAELTRTGAIIADLQIKISKRR